MFSKKLHILSISIFLIIAVTTISALIMRVEEPVFSIESGFYEAPVLLKLSAKSKYDKLYYTLDGSEPTENSLLYDAPIEIKDASQNGNFYSNIPNISTVEEYVPPFNVDKATVVKVMAVNRFNQKSKIISKVYFIGYSEKEGYDDINVISIVMDPSDLFSDQTGIYVLGDTYAAAMNEGTYDNAYTTPTNYSQRGNDWQRPAEITIFDKSRQILMQSTIGVQIHGGWSRHLPQKGFNLYEQDDSENNAYKLDEYMLRTSGQMDTYETMLRDAFNQKLAEGRNIASQPSEPCIVFINGEFWGLYNLQKRFSKAYFINNYKIPEENLIVLKNEEVRVGDSGDQILYDKLIDFVTTHDLSDSEYYDQLCGMIDIQNYIDYLCFECYIANMDWPTNNDCCFRSKKYSEASPYSDAKWRWGIFDTDEMCGFDSNPFSEGAHWIGNPLTQPLMESLMNSPEFRKQFSITFMDMANTNFEYTSVHKKLYDMANIYAVPMVKTQQRFKTMEYTEDTFWEYIQGFDDFYRERKSYVVPYVAEAFGLDGSLGNITVSVNDTDAGQIKVNTVYAKMTDNKWCGQYFTDYPITVTAIPNDGYKFVEWTGAASGQSQSIDISVNGEMELSAYFEKMSE